MDLDIELRGLCLRPRLHVGDGLEVLRVKVYSAASSFT